MLVVGEPASVQLACDRIVTTIYTAADTSLDITQRVLIPDAASGLIIGHDGARLGDLRQEAGVASIQVRSLLPVVPDCPGNDVESLWVPLLPSGGIWLSFFRLQRRPLDRAPYWDGCVPFPWCLVEAVDVAS